jgi:hypothetical protein
MQIFRGYWSQKWLEAHIYHVNAFPMRNPKNQEKRQKQQDRWLNNVSSFVMRQCHKLVQSLNVCSSSLVKIHATQSSVVRQLRFGIIEGSYRDEFVHRRARLRLRQRVSW